MFICVHICDINLLEHMSISSATKLQDKRPCVSSHGMAIGPASGRVVVHSHVIPQGIRIVEGVGVACDCRHKVHGQPGQQGNAGLAKA